MTKERLQLFADKINELNAEFAADLPQADSAIETVLYGLAEIVDEDAKANESSPVINSILITVSEELRHAAFNYYVSWK